MFILPAKLEIVSNNGTRKMIEIKQDVLTFGSHPKCSVRLMSAGISSEHAQILRTGDGYFLVNMDEKNPVTLNAAPIRNKIRKQLKQNDVVTLGKEIKIIFSFGNLASSASTHNSKKLSSNLILGILAVLAVVSLGIIIFPSKSQPSADIAEEKTSQKNAADTAPIQSFDSVNASDLSPVNSEMANANVGNGANMITNGQNQKTESNTARTAGNTSKTLKYESKMIGIISSISGKDNFVFSDNFDRMVADRIEKYKKDYPAFYDNVKENSQNINREFTNAGINLKLAYLLAFSRSDSKFSDKNIFNISENTLKDGYDGDGDFKTLAVYTKDLLGAFEQDYLKTIANMGIKVSDAGKIRAALNNSPTGSINSKVIDKKRFSEKELNLLADFFAAGIVANSPKDFGLKTDEIDSLQ